jgi:hypothetical protein
MADVLTEFKNSKISHLINKYNADVKSIANYYSNLIISISRSRFTLSYKKNTINNLNKNISNKLNDLKKKLDINILNIKNLSYNQIVPGQNKNALLIGINYTGTQYELNGCINDANSIYLLLNSLNFQNIEILTDNTSIKPTRDNIISKFTNLLSKANSGDVIFFSYSGHGSYIQDQNNNEVTGNDQMIIPSDFNSILDDELKKIIKTNLKSGVTLISIFDCCFSGSVLDLKYQYLDSLDNNNLTLNANETDTNGNVIMISGCSDIQTSADAFINNKNQGALTWAFLETFNYQKNLTWKQLLQGMRDLLKSSKFDQIPQLSSGKLIDIETAVFI